MDIRETVDAEGLGEYFDDFLDLVELFGVLEEKHGGERWDSTVTDDSPKYFLKKGATLLCEISFFGATQFPFWEPPDFLVGIHFGASATIFSHSSMS